MKTKIATVLFTCLCLFSCLSALPEWLFKYAETNVEFHTYVEVQESITLPIPKRGYFYTKWIIETNDAPRVAMEGFDSFPQTQGLTNFGRFGFITTNTIAQWYCDKEHLDRSEQTFTEYVSSNLVSFLVWRGQTNRHYLESTPITNIVHHWHWDKKRVWTD